MPKKNRLTRLASSPTTVAPPTLCTTHSTQRMLQWLSSQVGRNTLPLMIYHRSCSYLCLWVPHDDVDDYDEQRGDEDVNVNENENGTECSSGASFAILGVNICLGALWLSAFKPPLIYAKWLLGFWHKLPVSSVDLPIGIRFALALEAIQLGAQHLWSVAPFIANI